MKQQGRDEQEFAFIKEKIKDKPINKRRMLLRMGYNLLCAVIFGAAACFVFVLLKPYMEEWLYPEKESTISIPKDDLPQNEGNNKEEEGQENEQQNEQEQPDVQGNSGEGVQTKPEEQQPPAVVVEELELEDYQALQNKLYDIGKQANKSVVTVTGVTSSKDWFDTPYENENRSAGIIIGNNGQELLILAEKKIIANAQEINITFIDETEVSAFLKKYDGNTGIAVIGVPLAEIPKATMEKIEVAVLGNSYMIAQGTAVIAIGSPLGTSYSILCGTITSSQNRVSTIDTNYTVFTTDIVGSASGSGVLLNLKGEIVGLVLQDFSNQNDRNTITALSISELKQIIEDLSNNRDVPYIGLRISTVTDQIAREFGIPKGVYIKSVELDSPAMRAGLQEADVITAINGEEVTTVEQYFQKIYAMQPEDTVSITIKRQNGNQYVDLECTVIVGILQ
ncbi:serine protease [Lachnospiraceae bacterium]|nr:serine protease [Lachnospiraceae bacterium]